MRNILFAILIGVFSNSLIAQNRFQNSTIRAEYNVTFQYDSTDENSLISEKMLLLIQGDKSLFVSSNLLKKDSIKNAVKLNFQPGSALNMSNIDIPSSFFRFKIKKAYANSKIEIFDNINAENYRYTVPKENMDWKILSENKNIKGYQCQKARGYYRGRVFTAWFTQEIPISDGPYVFNGLPGLIIDIVDDKKHYHFELIQISKVNEVRTDYPEDYIELSEAQFIKIRENFRLHPIEELNKIASIDWTPEDILRIRNKYLKRNNPIEKSLK